MTAARDLQDTFPEGKDGDSQNGMLSLIPIEVLERTFDAMLEEVGKHVPGSDHTTRRLIWYTPE